jgi:hypothetical protein
MASKSQAAFLEVFRVQGAGDREIIRPRVIHG